MSNKCLKKPDKNTKAKTRSTINITVPQVILISFCFFVLQCPDNQSQWLAEKKRPHPRPDLRKHWGQRSLRWSGRHQQELVLRGGSHETKNAQHVHQGSQVRSCCLESKRRSTNVVLMLGRRRRRRSDIKTTLVWPRKLLLSRKHETLDHCCFNAGPDDGSTLTLTPLYHDYSSF